jgi:DNA polymerase-3 subunit epsilon
MHTTFTALDFETAQHARNSICQVGLVCFEAGKIVREINLLVRPPNNYYRYDFIDIHGITPDDTADAPTFAAVWPQLEPYIAGQRVVAHNGPRFDFSVLRHTLAHYGLTEPTYEGICTLSIYGRSLKILCAEYGIELDHHDALSDARACARLYLKSLAPCKV